MYVDPDWMLAFKKELYKSFVVYLGKLQYGLDIDDTAEYLLSVIMLLHVYRKIPLFLIRVHDELFSRSQTRINTQNKCGTMLTIGESRQRVYRHSFYCYSP